MNHEHDKAIQESERNAAAAEYFEARPFFAAARESERIFDGGFDRGWAAHARWPRNFCPDCGQRTPAGSVHTCSPQSDADGWIPWAGGGRPVNGSTRVSARLRNGSELSGLAVRFYWDHDDHAYDVLAYRVAKDAP